MLYEIEKIEFKFKMTDEIYKEVIAFANTEGRTIFIGVDIEGNEVGIEDDVDHIYTKVTNGIRDAILPDVTVFVRYMLQDNKVIRIDVGEGSFKPYYLKGKGLKPSGVYIRQGTSSVPASQEQIRRMIKISDGDIYEEMRSIRQDLTFETSWDIFKSHGVSFDEEKYIALGICDLSGDMYTNLGLLLSDQCKHSVKVAVFADEGNTVFKAHKEFTGSIFKQMEDAYEYLVLNNQNRSVIQGLERIDYWDYPADAIRECLLNALIHREYSFSGSIIINVNDKQMEFISLGGLLPGLSSDDIRSGISQPRNRRMAEVFSRLNFIESYGTGIRRIYSLYSDCFVQPKIEITPNTFRFILPNMNTAPPIKEAELEDEEKPKKEISPQMQTVLKYLDKNTVMGEEEVKEILGVKRTRAYVLMKKLIEAGLVEVKGRGVNKKYQLKS